MTWRSTPFVRKSIDEASYRQPFRPRRDGSVWSTVNVRRAQELIESGRMQPPGLEAFARRKEDFERRYSFEQAEVALGDEYEAELRENAEAWAAGPASDPLPPKLRFLGRRQPAPSDRPLSSQPLQVLEHDCPVALHLVLG